MRQPPAQSGGFATALLACAMLALAGQTLAEEAAEEATEEEDAAAEAEATPEEPDEATAEDDAAEDDIPSGETAPRVVDISTVYVGDHIFVPLRSGPSNGHRIVHRGVATGTPLQATGIEQDGFVQILRSNGNEAWLEEQFVSRDRIAREQLEDAQAELAALEERLAGRSPADADNVRLASDLQQARDDLATAQAEATNLHRQLAGLEQQVGELRNLPAGRLRDELQALQAHGDRIGAENEQLEARLSAMESSQQFRWMLIGAGLLLGGLVLGVVIKSRPQRRGAWP